MKCSYLLVLMIVTTIGVSSCKKYDDGPAISLRSRSERVANQCRIAKATNDGQDVTSDFENYNVSFSKGGNASLTEKYKFLGVNYEFTTNGTWSFESNEEKININYENDLADATYITKRLKEKELWVQQEGTNLELELVPN